METAYQRLSHGEPNIPLSKIHKSEMYGVISEMRDEVTLGQYSWNLETGDVEILLTRRPLYAYHPPQKVAPFQYDMDRLNEFYSHRRVI